MRLKIMKILMENPSNINRLSETLKVNYRTVEHHVKVLISNNLLDVEGDGYGKIYFPSSVFTRNLDTLKDILYKQNLKWEEI
ncbi:winged helix-turn-helix domain-containing protein [Caldiplasma sukawensis]